MLPIRSGQFVLVPSLWFPFSFLPSCSSTPINCTALRSTASRLCLSLDLERADGCMQHSHYGTVYILHLYVGYIQDASTVQVVLVHAWFVNCKAHGQRSSINVVVAAAALQVTVP